MTDIRFVKPEEVTLPISGGYTITIRKRLNAGQRRDSYRRMYRELPDGRTIVDKLLTGLSLITSYLLDWTVVGFDGTVQPIRNIETDELVDILNALDEETFTEIKEAIETHEGVTAAAREQEKKLPAGETVS